MSIKTYSAAALLALFVTAGLSSCGKKTDDDTATTVDTSATLTSGSTDNVTITPAEHGPQYAGAKIQIVSPREGQVIENANDSVFVVLNVTGMEIAKPTQGDSTKGLNYSKQGQHIHVIIDDKPYMANYVNGQPFNVGVLASGAHTIRVFPSRSWHESVKVPAAFASRAFFVGAKPAGDSLAAELKQPFITYSRPKGNYSASDSVILLDFFATNLKLDSAGHKVKVSVNGKEIATLSEWRPYHIRGLGNGEHTIALQLIDAQGNAVPGRFNNPSQKITIQ
jgi:hypothetical protein